MSTFGATTMVLKKRPFASVAATLRKRRFFRVSKSLAPNKHASHCQKNEEAVADKGPVLLKVTDLTFVARFPNLCENMFWASDRQLSASEAQLVAITMLPAKNAS